MANAAGGTDELAKAFAEHTADEWREKLEPFSGQWTMVQNTLEVAADPQSTANVYIQDYTTSDGVAFQLASPPVRFGDESPTPKRAPEFNEHGDEILESIGLDWETHRRPEGPRRRRLATPSRSNRLDPPSGSPARAGPTVTGAPFSGEPSTWCHQGGRADLGRVRAPWTTSRS